MTRHEVDRTDREITPDDLATWLLFFLESHGATVTLREDRSVRVDLDTMPGLNGDTVHRWAPIITNLIPEFREILKARRIDEAVPARSEPTNSRGRYRPSAAYLYRLLRSLTTE